jgi:hypothetical protein
MLCFIMLANAIATQMGFAGVFLEYFVCINSAFNVVEI